MAKKTIDGNTAAAHVAYAMSDVAAIYPITPSSVMGELCDEYAAAGRKNVFDQVLKVVEMQSEAGAAGAVHGSLATGALTTTFTASQGLLLMIPNMYKIAGELIPTVFHVSARALATHALSIFGDHSDVMSARQTGFAILASASVQEVMDLATVAHAATLKASVPFLHFFDGFRTSHETQKVEEIPYETLAKFNDMEAIKAFRARGLNPERPQLRGTAQNPDIYFQGREASNKYYNAVPNIVSCVMDEVAKVTGRCYKLFDYVGAPDATDIIITMGSSCEVVEETVNYLNGKGAKLGLIKVRLYRPFSAEHFLAVMPETVARIAVLDRTKEPGSLGEPLYQDIVTVLAEAHRQLVVIGGRYGLGSKDFNPSMVKAVFDNLASASPKNHFSVGIVDDVTFLSLPVTELVDASVPGTIRCKFFGLGADGTVGATKNSIKIIGDHTDMYAQGYWAYDSKKSGGITVSHLRFGTSPITAPYFIDQADFIACHNMSYVGKLNLLEGIKEGGVFLLNSPWSAAEMEEKLPAGMKRTLAEKKVRFYNLDAIEIASQVGLGGKISTIMQTAFFKLAQVIPVDEAIAYIKDGIKKSFGRKGDDVVNMNFAAVDKAIEALEEISVPSAWAEAIDEAAASKDAPAFISSVVDPVNALAGDYLPVSVFSSDGIMPTATTQYEKRGVAIDVPVWIADACIQCNQCSFVCPHAAIKPYLATADDLQGIPEGLASKAATGKELAGLQFVMQVSPLDCLGCGNCADICPSKTKALVMKPLEDVAAIEIAKYEFCGKLPNRTPELNFENVKNSQFKKPLFEFSGACAGCGETPYVKLITQLFGDRMVIANATGCSSIYGGSAPVCPYCVDEKGHGPAWANSLFEDNAEFGFGFTLAYGQRRSKLADLMVSLQGSDISAEAKEAFGKWVDGMNDAKLSREAGDRIKSLLSAELANACCDDVKDKLLEISESQDILTKPSIWVFGGDGWAYDIGYGGLDHVLATGGDINVLVMDTEVYSNTGGQASKATPTGAIARFAAAGKRTRKKDLGMMAMSYGYVYVASVAMGANKAQYLKAILEAESYDGPSLIIAYAPCINHGIVAGMGKSQEEEKRAVDSGYWPLYRYNPVLLSEGKNPFIFDSADKTTDGFQDFLKGEVRYSSLTKMVPEKAEDLFKQAEADANVRIAMYKKLAQ